MVGCNKDENEESAFDLGEEALENENVDEAKEQFGKASEDNQEQAEAYLEIIESAELIDQSLKNQDDDVAADTYYEIEKDDNYSKVTFIFMDDEEKLEEILNSRAAIDEKISALLDFFDPEDPEMSANELYLLKSDDMLEDTYLTSEQETLIKDFQEAVQKRIEDIAAGKETAQQDQEEQEKTEQEEQEEQEKAEQEEQNHQQAEEENKEQEADENKEQETEESEQQDNEGNQQQENDKPNKDKNENESNELTHDEAKDKVLKYLYGNDVILEDTIEDSNFNLDYDHDESGEYVFHLYEVVQHEGEVGHTATVGWYAVDPATGNVTDNMAN